jgi:ferrochelatase
LAEFLFDPRVVEIPRVIWWLILHGIVLRVRPSKSAKAYRSIWTDRGSPLMVFTEDLGVSVQRVFQETLGEEVIVTVAMRYGLPSIRQRLESLKERGVDRIVIVPLYPQYSAATTASTFDAVSAAMARWRHIPELAFLSDYHDEPDYIEAVASSIREHWAQNGRAQVLVLSFHGLPERSRRQGDPYYDQCLKTGQAIAAALGLKEAEWRLVFQSRFGAEEWLKPYCIEVLKALPGEGVRSVDLICPGFSVDCLETLEEIAIANKEEFMAAGGEQYRYIPALNARPDHAKFIASLVLKRLAGSGGA